MSTTGISLGAGNFVAAERLKELLDAEAQDRVLILPCPIGATVYGIRPRSCTGEAWLDCDYYVDSYSCIGCMRKGQEVYAHRFGLLDIERVGKGLWLDRQEAEAELRRRGGDTDG